MPGGLGGAWPCDLCPQAYALICDDVRISCVNTLAKGGKQAGLACRLAHSRHSDYYGRREESL